jgi:hypothetical protein
VKVSIVIPTVDGREAYLGKCVKYYTERTDADVELIIERNLFSGGLAWQVGSEKATGDYLHLTNDDIVPGEDWLSHCVQSCEVGNVPVVCVVWGTAEVFDENNNPIPGNPTNQYTTHFEGHHKIQPNGKLAKLKNESEYPSLPFCSMEQWQNIAPMIPTQYATDKWFGYRAKLAGYPNECVESKFYHYVASEGRDGMIDGWLGQDRLTFDANIAYPMYKSGELKLDEFHPEYQTLKGRQMSRDWYEKNVPRPPEGYPWEIIKGYE